MMAEGLTIKQENFAMAYVETGNASEAYRRAYDASKTKPEVVAVKASQLLSHDKVSVRVAELKAGVAKRHTLTVDDLIAELDEARELAKETGKAAPLVAATMGKAKLLGLGSENVVHAGEVVHEIRRRVIDG